MWDMKKMLLYGLILMLSLQAAEQKPYPKKQSKKTGIKAVQQKDSEVPAVTQLSSVGTYSAYTSRNLPPRLRIYDPTINALNQRAAGSNIRISGTNIVGMPKGSYGFANGRILLRTTTATSSGSGYGSGSVGTGTSINSTGTSEATIGVNGKATYAGSGLWGNSVPLKAYSTTDSVKVNHP